MTVGLLVVEAVLWLSLLGEVQGEGQHHLLLFLLLPTILSSLAWLCSSITGRYEILNLSTDTVCVLLFLLLFSLAQLESRLDTVKPQSSRSCATTCSTRLLLMFRCLNQPSLPRPQRQKKVGSVVALLPGKFLRVRKVFAR